jgi:outer membrane protein TolC
VKLRLIAFLLLISLSGKASDSTIVLNLDTFIYYVKNFHPVAKQAQLKVNEGNANMLTARGNFDPKISSTLDEKYYGQKEYFQYFNAGISIPTWAGVDIKSGYNSTYGDFFNPESKTPDAGLYQVGVSVPVLQGLLFDQRRNAFRQAEVYRKSTVEEQRLMLNDLLLEAGTAYWNWFQSYQNFKVLEEVYAVNQQRFAGIKSSATFGDRPMLDTLEASVQLQERYLSKEQARLEFIKRSYEISAYLWTEDELPLLISEGTTPSLSLPVITLNMQGDLDDVLKQNPHINLANYKIESLEFDKRWKQEQLKPVLNVNYNALSYASTNSEALTYNLNNYKWGFSFAVPVLLRKERGSLQLAKIKLQDAGYERERKSNIITNKILAGRQELKLLNEQIVSYQQTVRGYEQLLYAENTLFETGESSLFLVNTRETNMINARLKLVDIQTKQQKSALMLKYNMGNMVE